MSQIPICSEHAQRVAAGERWVYRYTDGSPFAVHSLLMGGDLPPRLSGASLIEDGTSSDAEYAVLRLELVGADDVRRDVDILLTRDVEAIFELVRAIGPLAD